MKNLSIYMALACLFVFCIGCGSGLKPLEFKHYIENTDNPFIKEMRVGNFTITCMYMPAQYMAVNYFKSNSIDRNEFEVKLKDYSNFDLYRIEIKTNDSRNLQGMEDYFGFYMQESIVRACGSVYNPCTIYQAEPMNALRGTQRIDIGFENSDCGNRQIILKDLPFSDKPLLFDFDKNKMTIPDIKLN